MSHCFAAPAAREDLFEIWDYIAEQSGCDRADHMLRVLHDAMGKLAETPGLGHARDDLARRSGDGVRGRRAKLTTGS